MKGSEITVIGKYAERRIYGDISIGDNTDCLVLVTKELRGEEMRIILDKEDVANIIEAMRFETTYRKRIYEN